MLHFVSVASSRGWFGPDAGWRWNRHSWLLSGTLDEETIIDAATGRFVLVALGFTVGAVGYVLSRSWWVPVLVATALPSTLCCVIQWDGHRTTLLEDGALGILINILVIAWAVG